MEVPYVKLELSTSNKKVIKQHTCPFVTDKNKDLQILCNCADYCIMRTFMVAFPESRVKK